MTSTIEMPKLSDTMSVGTVVKWHKNVGDQVENGDTLAEIETDKATMELENFDDGFLLKIIVQEGEEAPIGSPLAIVGEKGESVEDDLGLNQQDSEKNIGVIDEKANEHDSFDGNSGEPKEQNNEDLLSEKSVPKPNVQQDLDTSNTGDGRIAISPLAKKIAKENNLDLSSIKGSGPGGRIVKKDLIETTGSVSAEGEVSKEESFASSNSSVASNPMSAGLLVSKTVPHSKMRATIAQRLSESKSTIPHFYLQKEINIKPLLDARIAINENLAEQADARGNPNFNKISVNDLVLKACSESIKWHPEINTSWSDNEIVFFDQVHLSFGVAVDGGLVTPVIRNAGALSLVDISLEAKDLISRARNKKLSPEAMNGSTFTVTNLGMYGIDFFSGIINPPNAAILSVGSSTAKPVLDEHGRVVAGKTLTLGLSCDHRLVDGACGASFLGTLAKNLESPTRMLL